MRATPVPSAMDVRELIEGLLGRDVDVTTDALPVNPAEDGGACVGVYVDDQLGTRAMVVMDLALSCWVGAAIALVPARTAAGCVEDHAIADDLLENTAEVLNVAASLFNVEGARHLRLYRVYAPGEEVPGDIRGRVLAYVPRIDLTVDVAGYGEGRVSVLVL